MVGSWGSGYQAEITVTAATGPDARSLTWDLPAGESVTPSWNTELVAPGENTTVTNAAYNEPLDAGESADFGPLGSSWIDPSLPEPVCTAL